MALHPLLTENNNSWGVKTLANGSPAYEHIIDFNGDTSNKDEFIADNFFNGNKDWKQLVKNADSKGDTEYDENSWSFAYDVPQGQKWTDILNKNYVIVYDDLTDEFSYWACQGSTNANHTIITFNAVRDWMFDDKLNVNTMFNPNAQSVINRSHIDDVIDKKWNISQDGENSVVEPIEDFTEGNFKPIKSENVYFPINLIDKFEGTFAEFEDFKKECIRGFQCFAFSANIQQEPQRIRVYFVGWNSADYNLFKTDVLGSSAIREKGLMSTSFKKTEIINPIINAIIPNSEKILIPTKKTSTDPWNWRQAKTSMTLSPQLVKTFPIPYFPIQVEDIETIKLTGDVIDRTYSIIMKKRFQVNENRDENLTNAIAVDVAGDSGSQPTIYSMIVKQQINDYEITTPYNNLLKANYDTDINKPFQINNVAKLHKYPYLQTYIKHFGDGKLNVMPQLLTSDFRWELLFTYAPDVWHIFAKVKDKELSGYYNSNFNYGLTLSIVSSFTFPQLNDAYIEYITRNNDQINQQSRRMGINLGLGLVGSTFGLRQLFNQKQPENPMRQNEVDRNENILNTGYVGDGRTKAGRAFAGTQAQSLANLTNLAITNPISKSIGISMIGNIILGGASTIASSISDIQQQKAMLSGLKRNPTQVSGNAGDILGVGGITELSIVEFTDELWPELKLSVAQYFQMYGSQLNNRFRNINDYINTRYYFNYFQTQDLFQNFNPAIQINNGAKNLINNSFISGCWIWYYRSKTTWKGVKNFDVNNIQMSLMPIDIDVDKDNLILWI